MKSSEKNCICKIKIDLQSFVFNNYLCGTIVSSRDEENVPIDGIVVFEEDGEFHYRKEKYLEKATLRYDALKTINDEFGSPLRHGITYYVLIWYDLVISFKSLGNCPY